MSEPSRFFSRLCVAAGILALASCDGGAPSRESARAQATSAICQRIDMCGQIGDGKSFPTLDACQLKWQANWDGAWPASACDGKVDAAQFDVCISAIKGTACSLADLAVTIGKCSATNVCDAASPDGG